MVKILSTEVGVCLQDTVIVDQDFVDTYNNPKNRELIKNMLSDLKIEHTLSDENESIASIIIKEEITGENIMSFITELQAAHDAFRMHVRKIKNDVKKDEKTCPEEGEIKENLQNLYDTLDNFTTGNVFITIPMEDCPGVISAIVSSNIFKKIIQKYICE
jgi:hypothetical protein